MVRALPTRLGRLMMLPLSQRVRIMLWLTAVLPPLALVVAGARARVDELLYGCQVGDCPALWMSPAQRAALDASGFGAERMAWYIDALSGVMVGMALLGAWRIVRGRRRGAVAFLAAVVLVYVASALTFNPYALGRAHPERFWMVALFSVVVEVGIAALLLLFPDGRFRPRWSRWVLLGWAAWSVFQQTPRAALLRVGHDVDLATAALVVFGLATLVYRCRSGFSLVDSQKTKWVLPAVLGQVFFLVVASGLTVLRSSASGEHNLVDYLLLVAMLHVYVALFALVPLSLGFAILRQRLWDIDLVLHRLFSFGTTAAALSAVFAVTFLAFQTLSRLLLGSVNHAAVAAVAVLLTGLSFKPVARTLHRFVDRSLFGIGLDYQVVDRSMLEADALRRRLEQHELLRGYTGWQLVGGGGRASVFRAEHPGRERPVAVKVLRIGEEQEIGAQRFDREASIVTALDHPNIVRLFGHSSSDGLRVMVMDYVSDRDLAQLMPAQGLPYEHAVQLLADLCSALEYAHRAGIVHRDIKPSNILLRRVYDESVRFRAVLTDFGIAKLPEETNEITRTTLLGTVAYMSPEQIRSPSKVDQRSDIYSLGAVAYQMFTGSVPFKAPNATAVLLAHLQQPPVDPRELRPDLPEWTATAIVRALAKRPSERWQSALAFLEAVRSPQQQIADVG